MRGTSKEIRELFKAVTSVDGWEGRRRNNGHYLIQGPRKEKVYCSATPSDHRAIHRIKRDLSRAGLDLDRVDD
jgi:hypothetical protein